MKGLPKSLLTLCKVFTDGERLMELLGAVHSDEEHDNGEFEASGDEYEGLQHLLLNFVPAKMAVKKYSRA